MASGAGFPPMRKGARIPTAGCAVCALRSFLHVTTLRQEQSLLPRGRACGGFTRICLKGCPVHGNTVPWNVTRENFVHPR